ncbi:class I adenylate-forming enzyme family protein [Streptomyces sp. NPDC021093]|uniref:class I adenylate-forming enzyme family protein n=1 Tax=Streptomyces sp. NPDC021093 TaxID=3365112 RepID=UPI0037BC0399
MWLERILTRQVALAPDAVALRDAHRELTWRQLQAEVHALAGRIVRQVSEGARVLTMSQNRLEVLVTYLACAAANTVVVPVNADLADSEVSYILDYVEPELAIAQRTSVGRLAGLAPALETWPIEDVPDAVAGWDGTPRLRPAGLDDAFAILHTSATTGHPKGVLTTHRSLQAQAMSWLGDVRPPTGTVYLNASPLFHGSMVIALDYLAAGGTVCVLDRFTPQSCLRALEEWRVAHVLMVPSMIRLLVQTKALQTADLSSVDLIIHTAEPMPESLHNLAVARLGRPLLNTYGLTEGGGPVVTSRSGRLSEPPRHAGARCAGVAMLGVDAEVRTKDGRPAGVGEVGEICLRGEGTMREYWRRPEATAETLRDGWLHTGDLGYVEEDGRLWTVDRRTDLILRGGQNVYPAEIERVLRLSSNVTDVAVVAAPSEAWGHTPWAFVQPVDADSFDEQELLGLAVRELASYKRPSRFLPVEHIPRNPAGKLLRRQMRDRAAAILAEETGRKAATPV